MFPNPTNFVCLALAGCETNTLAGIVEKCFLQNGSEPPKSPALRPCPTAARLSRIPALSCQVDKEHRLASRAGEAFGGAMDSVTNAVSKKDDGQDSWGGAAKK